MLVSTMNCFFRHAAHQAFWKVSMDSGSVYPRRFRFSGRLHTDNQPVFDTRCNLPHLPHNSMQALFPGIYQAGNWKLQLPQDSVLLFQLHMI